MSTLFPEAFDGPSDAARRAKARGRPHLPAHLRRPRPECILKNLAPKQQAELWAFRETRGNSAAATLALARELSGRPGLDRSALNAWVVWYDLRRRTERFADVLDTMADVPAAYGIPDADAADLREAGLVMVMSEAIASGDAHAFVAAAKLQLEGAGKRGTPSRRRGLEPFPLPA